MTGLRAHCLIRVLTAWPVGVPLEAVSRGAASEGYGRAKATRRLSGQEKQLVRVAGFISSSGGWWQLPYTSPPETSSPEQLPLPLETSRE